MFRLAFLGLFVVGIFAMFMIAIGFWVLCAAAAMGLIALIVHVIRVEVREHKRAVYERKVPASWREKNPTGLDSRERHAELLARSIRVAKDSPIVTIRGLAAVMNVSVPVAEVLVQYLQSKFVIGPANQSGAHRVLDRHEALLARAKAEVALSQQLRAAH
jgi:hypothetical protein